MVHAASQLLVVLKILEAYLIDLEKLAKLLIDTAHFNVELVSRTALSACSLLANKRMKLILTVKQKAIIFFRKSASM